MGVAQFGKLAISARPETFRDQVWIDSFRGRGLGRCLITRLLSRLNANVDIWVVFHSGKIGISKFACKIIALILKLIDFEHALGSQRLISILEQLSANSTPLTLFPRLVSSRPGRWKYPSPF